MYVSVKIKTPTKATWQLTLIKMAKKGIGAGYYLHVEPGRSFVAGGIWMPEPAVLAGIRQEIDYNFTDWKKLIDHKNFRKNFPEAVKGEEALKRPPKGYDENNPAIEFLKMKSFIVSKPYADSDLVNTDFIKEVTKTFNVMKPFINFLNTSLH